MSKFKVLVIGDLHCKTSNIRDSLILEAKLNKLLVKCPVDAIILLGDIGDYHDRMPLYAWQSIVRIIRAISNHTKLFILMGNHDMINNKQYLTADHFYNVFKLFEMGNDITVVDKPLIMSLSSEELLLMPYVPPGRFLEAIKTTGKELKDFTTIFAHQEFFGAQLGAIESRVGDKYPTDGPMVISGHVHGRSNPNGQKNILYMNTPMNTAFGDGNKSTVSIFTFSGRPPPTEMLVNLGMPKKVTLSMDVKSFMKFEMESPDDHYRIKVIDKKIKISKLRQTDKYLEIKQKAKVLLKPTDEAIDRRAISTQSFLQILGEQVKDDQDVKKELECVQKIVKEL